MTKRLRHWKLAALAAVVLAAPAISASTTVQAYDPDLVVFHYTFYADEEKTQFVGLGQDTCNPGPPPWVSRPGTMLTPYYDAVAQYQCSASGPYLPPGWPY